ncbi:MAG: DegT/DnrJ/EryC1/StrS family aminotransferase [Chloroflexi bacterium]|nr:DegT/DnrJ/EryC1/StrS family aminotransferase [Chloroflexota bacterium]MBV9899009.1 DegT/DnrJ/EryC1/StrS family aminotransferase [Chloroflexota bacterium]
MALETRRRTAIEALSPTVPLRFRLADATIDQSDRAEVAQWLTSDAQLTQGPVVFQFEQQWSDWLGRRYSVFVNSGSSANLIMYYAALVSRRAPRRRVVVPAIAWATTIAPAIQLGFEPIMCDADAQTFGLDLNQLEDVCRKDPPDAVITVQTLGVPGDMRGLAALQERYGFLLMEDACPATGSTYRDRRVGTFGDMATFSLYFGHHLSTIEGGVVSTDDSYLYDLLLELRSHGWAKDLDAETEAELSRKNNVLEFNRIFTFYVPGFNVRNTDLAARFGLTQMRKVDWVVERRCVNQEVYESRFSNQPGFSFPRNPAGRTCSISFVALAASREHRDRVAAALRANGIETRPLGGGSMGRQPFWTERYGQVRMPVADAIHERSFMLPNHPYLTQQDVHEICDVALSVAAGESGRAA